jgi:hypothetical protein
MNIKLLFALALVNIITVWATAYITQKATNTANIESSLELERQKKLGENAAIKKDIEEITKKIETVRYEISELSSRKQDKFIQLRTAIADYSTDLIILVEWKLQSVPIGEELWLPKVIKDSYTDFMSQWTKTYCSYMRIFLYSEKNDQAFVEEIHTIYQAIVAQYTITVIYYDILVCNSPFIQMRNSESDEYAKRIRTGLKEYISNRNLMQKESNNALNKIQNLLRQKLEENYNV